MPEFLDLYANQLNRKAHKIIEKYNVNNKLSVYLEEAFKKYWIDDIKDDLSRDLSILAIDSSSQHITTSNGGIFYVIRALALSRDKEYRDIIVDYDYAPASARSKNVLARKMEYLEHKVAIDAINEGFDGFILLDGSIYGRLSHIPLEINYTYDRSFIIEYFKILIELLSLCKDKSIPLIGISKESRTSFFKEFLLKEIAIENIDKINCNDKEIDRLFSMALDNKRDTLDELKRIEQEHGRSILRDLVDELIAKKPDFQLILTYAANKGYTKPLMLGASLRWLRFYNQIKKDPYSFIRTKFPLSSRDAGFIEYASNIIKMLPTLPSIISFHILPAINDTPLRIDMPAWYFGINSRLADVGWPKVADIDLSNILDLISSCYCGLDNYNIWLKAVDSKVKLKRKVFESIYLTRFEEIIGKRATARGYRRVRFP